MLLLAPTLAINTSLMNFDFIVISPNPTPTFLIISNDSLAGMPVETERDSSFITDLCM